MDGFSGYNQIHIHFVDQVKISFTSPWGNFYYMVMPFGLKNVGAFFQSVVSYCFHDLAHIILTCLDNLTDRSKLQSQHLDDLHTMFLQCCKYNLHLNSLKCVFYVPIRNVFGLHCVQRWYHP